MLSKTKDEPEESASDQVNAMFPNRHSHEKEKQIENLVRAGKR